MDSKEQTMNYYFTESRREGQVWKPWFEVVSDQFGVIANIGSGHGFATQAEADAAAQRALEVLARTGLWPNMCEAY
jgi:hypothetical protein